MLENKSEFNFSEPQRQSQAALILIIYNRFKNLISRFWYIIVIGLFTGKSNWGTSDPFSLVILFLTGFTAIFGIISYFRYYFWIEDDQLVIRSGVLKKTLTQIPFDRIQTIDFEQNLIHQALNVIGLKIDTAGTATSEIKMQALTKEKAQELRKFILSQKREVQLEELGEETQVLVQEDAKEIYGIDFARLVKIGLTENHIRSGFVILFGGFWFLDNVREAGVDVEGIGSQYYDQVLNSIVIIGIIAIFFVFVSMFISVARVFLKYFDLKFFRSYNGFKVISGLFNRKEVAALDSKIQLFEWKQNLIQKGLGYHNIILKQASSAEMGTKKSILVPGVNKTDIERVKDFLFPTRNEDNVQMTQLNKWSLWRPLMYLALLAILLATLFIYTKSYYNLTALIIVCILIVVRSIKKYHKAFYGVNDRAIFVKGGVFGHSKWMTMFHKIQSLEITQTPFQYRRKLASLQVHTASGSKTIPYIELDKAEYLYDYLTYKVEDSNEDWM